jgi:hypothetical protein
MHVERPSWAFLFRTAPPTLLFSFKAGSPAIIRAHCHEMLKSRKGAVKGKVFRPQHDFDRRLLAI